MIVPIIDALVRSRLAYEIDGYVCLDVAQLSGRHPAIAHAVARLTPEPVRYPAVPDYALWAPWLDGNASPWGRGLVTANLAYLESLLLQAAR